MVAEKPPLSVYYLVPFRPVAAEKRKFSVFCFPLLSFTDSNVFVSETVRKRKGMRWGERVREIGGKERARGWDRRERERKKKTVKKRYRERKRQR